MADFKIAYERTAKFEGGYQCDPDDNGNWAGGHKGIGELIGTNYGITAPELAAYLGRKITVSDMRNMSREIAAIIFKKNYWDPLRGDEITSQDIANELFDSAVNMGAGTAIMLAKRAQGLPVNTNMNDDLLNKLNNIS